MFTFILPECFLKSDDYLALNEREIHNFLARLEYINEVSENIGEWLSGKTSSWNKFNDFINDLELDISACQNLNLKPDSIVSNWIIHSVWRDENYDSGFQLELLPEMSKELTNLPLPSLQASKNEAELWLNDNKKAIDDAMSKAMQAKTISEFLSFLLMIDIIVSKILTASYIFRFIKEKQ